MDDESTPFSLIRADRRQLRKRSKVVYGNADRLEVAYAVMQSSSRVVHAQELAQTLGITASRVRAQLLALVDAGLMVMLPRTGQTQDYERLDDPFWDSVSAIVERWS
ncbi:MAG TPA: hypothetical protein VE972_04435 [Conexibacter sp.]|nr:hypothetical protein [Conexibacter sp.]